MAALPRPLPYRKSTVLTGLLLLALAACRPSLHPVPDVPIEDPDVLLDAVRARAERLGTMAVEARLSGRSDRGRARGRISILADASASRLRIDAWTPTDDLVATLTAGPAGFGYFERGSRACLAGPSCRENLRWLLPLGLGLDDAVRALFGIPPGIDLAGPWTIDFDRRIGAYRLQATPAPETRVRVWIRDDGTAVRADRATDGRMDYRMVFGAFGGDGIPRELAFESDADRSTVSVRYRDLQREPDLEPGDWEMSCPRGLSTRWMPCEETP